jgi:hypothetical protein
LAPSEQRKNKILWVKYHFEDLDEEGRITLKYIVDRM